LNGPIIDWYYRGDTSLGNNYATHITNPVLSSQILQHPHIDFDGPCKGYKIDTGYMDGKIREEKYGSIMRGELKFDKYGDEFGYLTNQYLFAELNYHPDYIDLGEPDDDNYTDFYSKYSTTNMMSILEVQNNIDSGALSTAVTINAEISTSNDIEKIRILVNDIYLRSLLDTNYEDGYTKEDIAYLLKYSTLNANINGDGIYSSWVMLGIDPDQIKNRSKQNFVNNSDTTIAGNFKVYPNPANESIIIDYSSDISLLQKCQIEFYDIYGKLIKTVAIETSNQSVNINDLSNGMYIYRITNFNSILQKNKLIKM